MSKRSNFGLYLSIFLMFFGIIVGFCFLAKVYTGPFWVKMVVFLVVLFILVCLFVALKQYIELINSVNKDKKD